MKYILLAIMFFYTPAVFAQELLSDSEIRLLNSDGGLKDEYPGKPPFEKYYNNILPILDKIERGIKVSPNDPNWWYYRQLAYLALVGLRIEELIHEGLKYKEYQQDEKVESFRNDWKASRKKMIELDNDENPQVDAYKYNDIFLGLPDKEAVIAWKRILKFPPVGENSDSRVRDYMDYTGAHIRLGQFDEAVKVLESMSPDKYIQMMQQDTGEFSNEWIQQQINEVKKMEQEAAIKDTYAQADTYSAPRPAAVEPVKAVGPKKVAEPVVKSQPAPAPDNTMLWWLLGGGVGLLGVIVLLMRRKQAK